MNHDEEKIYDRLVKSLEEKILVECLIARKDADLEKIKELYKQYKEEARDYQTHKLYLFAEEHECASIVGSRLQALELSNPNWDLAIDNWKYRLTQRFEALDALAAALKAENIPIIALKNAGIARGIYPYIEECPMGDIDTLVKKSDFVRAHEVVMKQGFSFGFRAEETIEEEGVKAGLISGGTEYKKELTDDILWLELQWRPIAGRWIAPEAEPVADDLFETSLSIEGSDVRLLDPVSNLLQVCLHTAKHSYVRAPGLRLHTDVDRIVRAYPDLDWNLFLQRVRDMKVKTSVYFSLLIPKILLHTPISNDILDELRPSEKQYQFILNSICKAGLFHPMRSKFSRPKYLAFTAMLYDSPAVCFKSAFPSPGFMRERYGLSSDLQLPLCYIKRFAGLLFKRVKT